MKWKGRCNDSVYYELGYLLDLFKDYMEKRKRIYLILVFFIGNNSYKVGKKCLII